MIPQERVNEAAKEFNPNNNNLIDTGFRAGVRFAEAELQPKPTDADKAEFVKYCKEARTEFVRKFWELHEGGTKERVIAEDLLIAYDQLLNRYNQ